METAETLALSVDHLKNEFSLAQSQLDNLDDIILSLNNPELEQELHNISMNLRSSLNRMRKGLLPVEKAEHA